MKLNNLVELLRVRAERQGCAPLYTFLGDGEVETAHLTFGQLESEARAIGAQLQKLGMAGERALLNFPPGLDFISAFFGCLYAGVVAVPVPLVSHPRRFTRVQKILDDAGAKVILTTEQLLTNLKGNLREESNVQPLTWLATNTLSGELVDQWQWPIVKMETLAYLQYTSGSTGDPKGVMVTHGNVLHNLAYLERGFDYSSESVSVSWLPHFHDMGLVNGIIQALYQGCGCFLMPPTVFIQNPFRWLQAISQYRGTHSGGPNFAYDLCVRKVTSEQRSVLDLRSWCVAYNGSEPIYKDTLVRFAESFRPCGFDRKVFYPAYGLAESTLKVSGGTKGESLVCATVLASALEQGHVVETFLNDGRSRTLVGCGRVTGEMKVIIVDPETRTPCASNQVGEIWVSGPSVAQGYWNQIEATHRTFRAFLADSGEGPFLRTGDLGFLKDGELFIAGRLKDLIIIRGSNYHPQDIERTVERSHPALRPGCGAAFSVEAQSEERLVVVQEIGRQEQRPDIKDIAGAIRQAASAEHDLQVYAVVLVKAGTLPKTSSGKVQRRACRAAFLSKRLQVIASSMSELLFSNVDESPLTREILLDLESNERQAVIKSYLKMKVARLVGLDPSQLGFHERLSSFGLDSIMAMELKGQFDLTFGVDLSFSQLLGGPTIEDLAVEIANRMNTLHASTETSFPLASGTEEEHPLSYGQQGLWVLHQEAPHTAAFNIPMAARIHGDLDIPDLERALQGLIDRHPCLRTTIHERNGQPFQKIHAFQQCHFHSLDASTWSSMELDSFLVEEAHRPFDLQNGPLFRVTLVAQSVQGQFLLMVAHHIVTDLWSLTILVDELRALYEAERAGRLAALPPLKWAYTDYVQWQANQMTGPEGERLWTYWQKQLDGELPVLHLPIDHPRPVTRTDRGASHVFKVGAVQTQRLKDLAK
ncbi:MAG: AMP-binding protein, partial [Nitrospinae bacterium]|nr:AMP-binding protein [Nitrospinota bacterium]